MLYSLHTVIVTLLLITALYSQSFDKRLTPLREKYKTFEYRAVIEQADVLIENSAGLDTADLCEIYRLKALSHYSLLDMDGALNSIVSLLNVKPDYSLDPEQNSPKVIAYFDEVRRHFAKQEAKPQPQIEMAYNEMSQKMDSLEMSQSIMNKSLVYSVLLPGSGHLKIEPSTKGWLLFGAGVITLSGSLYYIIDTNQKEKEYLNAIEKAEIEYKYDAYNTTYKRRNIFIIAYVSVWVFSQIDFLFLSQNRKITSYHISLHTKITPGQQQMLTMQISF
jgi:hypothetical protein